MSLFHRVYSNAIPFLSSGPLYGSKARVTVLSPHYS